MEAVADRGNAACTGEQYAGRAVGLYQRRRPAETVLYQLVQEHLERRGSDNQWNENLR